MCSMVSENVRKESKRAISALKSGNLRDAQKHLDQARSSAPEDPGVNFLWQNHGDCTQSRLEVAEAPDPDKGNKKVELF